MFTPRSSPRRAGPCRRWGGWDMHMSGGAGSCFLAGGGRPLLADLTLCFSQVFGLRLVEIDAKHHLYILVSDLPRAEGENLHK